MAQSPSNIETELFKLKREFLEYCELDKGQSSLTITVYDRYLSKFLEWLKNYKLEINSKQSVILNVSEESSKRNERAPQQIRVRSFVNTQDDNKINDQCEMVNEKLGLCPTDIDQEVVRQYRLHVNRLSDRYGKELKKSTQNYHILALRAFLRYLAFRGISSLSPEKVSIAKTGDRQITFLESEEIGAILNTADISSLSGMRDRAILELLFSTGMRVSELASMNIDDINFERGEIAVLGKGKKIRVVFLSENAIKSLGQYLEERGYCSNLKDENYRENFSADKSTSKNNTPLFLSNKGTRLTVRSIERIVKKYSMRAGLAKKVSPHTLRHSFATDLLISGADVRSVQSLLGHSSITTTQVYTHVTDQHLREIHQKYHGKSLPEDNQDTRDKEQ
ncbi:MAG: tyrosine-type recombinase/integrase [Patescibacteria group bacterium]|nr:tyrosine-type recombinase/integrase [Patescibacteria group bacterium]